MTEQARQPAPREDQADATEPEAADRPLEDLEPEEDEAAGVQGGQQMQDSGVRGPTQV